MSEKDELRRQVLERFTPASEEQIGPVLGLAAAVDRANAKDITELVYKSTAPGVDLGLNALRQVVEKRTKQEELTQAQKAQMRKSILTEKNTKEMLDMMRMLHG